MVDTHNFCYVHGMTEVNIVQRMVDLEGYIQINFGFVFDLKLQCN